ncbi:unnamed protein product [Absidia cylindrospora]
MSNITKQTLPPVGHAFAGSAGAMFALALVYPLDIIKTRIQVQTKGDGSDGKDQQEHYDSAWDGICQIVAKDGFSGLYAGLGSSLPVRHQRTSRIFTATHCFGINTMSNTTTTVVVHYRRAWNLTTRQQTLPAEERQGVFETCQTIVKEEGVAGLWRGIRPSLVLCINPSITYGSFEKIKQLVLKLLRTSVLSSGAAFGVGALSKTLATVITYPYIMAKVRMQWKPSKEMAGKVQAYKGALDVLARVMKQEGFFGWYRGMSTQISKAVLSQALLFMMKDIFTNYTILAYALLKNTGK